jgi:hypothetical protein
MIAREAEGRTRGLGTTECLGARQPIKPTAGIVMPTGRFDQNSARIHSGRRFRVRSSRSAVTNASLEFLFCGAHRGYVATATSPGHATLGAKIGLSRSTETDYAPRPVVVSSVNTRPSIRL